MPVPIAELFISVGADISGATSGLNALNAQLSRVGNQMQIAGRGLTSGLTVPILAVGSAMFKTGTDFEHAFTQVRRTVSGLDNTQLEELRQSLLAMSKTKAGGTKTASELADIAAVGGQLGLAGNEIKTFTSLVARLSLATNLPFEEIAEDVGRSLKVMNLAETEYEAFGSTIAALGNEMGGTERDIFEFSRRLAATLGSLGVKPDQILAIGAALSEVGINPEAGATAINKFFVEMVNSLNDASGASTEAKQKLQALKDTITDLSNSLEVAELRQKEFGRNTPASVVKANQIAIDKYKRELGQANTKMDDFSKTSAEGKLNIAGMAKVAGISEEEFRGLVKTDPAKAFASFASGLQRILGAGGPEALTKTLEDLGITEERQRETLLALAKSSASLPKALDVAAEAWRTQNKLMGEVDTAFEDLDNKLKLIANTAQTVLIDAFDKQRATIGTLVDQINNDLIPAFRDMAAAIPKLTPDQLKGIALIAGIGPGLLVIGGILSAVGSIISVLSAPAVLPVLLAIAGLGITFDQIANNWDRTKATLEKEPKLAAIVFMIDFVKKHGDEIKSVLSTIITSVQKWALDFNAGFASAIFGAGSIFEAFGTFLSTFFDTVILPILTRFQGWIAEHILGALIGLLEFGKSLGISTLPGGADIGTTIGTLKGEQAAAAATAGGGGGNDVTVTINNPQVTSQALLDKLGQQVANAITTALVMSERSVIVAPRPLPGQLPGTPF